MNKKYYPAIVDETVKKGWDKAWKKNKSWPSTLKVSFEVDADVYSRFVHEFLRHPEREYLTKQTLTLNDVITDLMDMYSKQKIHVKVGEGHYKSQTQNGLFALTRGLDSTEQSDTIELIGTEFWNDGQYDSEDVSEATKAPKALNGVKDIDVLFKKK